MKNLKTCSKIFVSTFILMLLFCLPTFAQENMTKLKVGDKIHVTLKAGETKKFLFTPDSSNDYTIYNFHSDKRIKMNLTPTLEPLKKFEDFGNGGGGYDISTTLISFSDYILEIKGYSNDIDFNLSCSKTDKEHKIITDIIDYKMFPMYTMDKMTKSIMNKGEEHEYKFRPAFYSECQVLMFETNTEMRLKVYAVNRKGNLELLDNTVFEGVHGMKISESICTDSDTQYYLIKIKDAESPDQGYYSFYTLYNE